jgi:hypothetical protein
MTCSASIQYFADSTGNASSTYPADTWKATMSVVDSTGLYGSATIAGGVPLDPLYGLEVNVAGINFGSFTPGQSSTSTAVTTILNTGNSAIDIKLSGSDLTSGSNSIPVNQLAYATSTFSYASCSLCQFLTGAPTSFAVNIPKSTTTSATSTSNVYWGIGVPNGTPSSAPGNPYQGVNTFTAVFPGG